MQYNKGERMKKQSLIALIVCVAFVLCITLTIGLTFKDKVALAEERNLSIKIAQLSDVHFYPEQLSNEKSSAYRNKLKTEAKFLGESGASLRETFAEMVGTTGNIKADAPEIVLISGDLTLNGEKIGHEYLAELLRDVTDMVRADPAHENFQILVIPGNHDIFNPNAKRYYPTQEEIDACASDAELEALLSDYVASTPTVDNQEFMDIYWSFGYAKAGDRNPRTGETSKLASNIELEFFYNSDEWYEDDYGVMTVHPPKDVVEKVDETKDYSLVNPYVRHGACSYIARTEKATIVCVDANSRAYIGTRAGETNADGSLIFATSADWDETTGGDVEERILRWICNSIKTDVQDEQLVFGMFHHNIVPHFTMEPDVLSLFTYDDYKKVGEVLADAGLKYVFTGHMHASDIAYTVSQKGNVIFDMEVGTAIGLGAAYRIFDLSSSGTGDSYTEDAYSQIFNVNKSLEYKTADSDEIKTTPAHYEYFKNKLENMVPTMIRGMVNADLYTKLTSAMSSLDEDHPFFGALGVDAINDLANFDLYPLVVKNGVAGLADSTREGYDLVAFVNDLLDYFCDFDFSYGTVEGGYKLPQVVFDIYGGHLMGTNPQTVPDNLKAFFGKLEDGTFVQWLVDLVYNTVVPQVDLILDAPIRFSTKTPAFTDQNGFDLSRAFEMKLSFGLDSIVRGLVQKFAFSYEKQVGTDEDGLPEYETVDCVDANGYSSLRNVLTALSKNAPTLVESLLENAIIGPVLAEFNIKTYYDQYFTLALEYLNKYFESDLATVAKSELLDKYVTEAFCKNLGTYGKDIVESMTVDESYDGGYLDENGNLINERVHLQYAQNGVVAHGEHSFTKTPVQVVATAENGLLPSQVSIANVTDEDGVLAHDQMKLQWVTKITVDIFNHGCPASFIKIATTKDGLASATPVSAIGKNVDWVYPTIDLGITFINMSYVYETYNLYNVKLDNLEADTFYYYVLGSDDYGWTDVRVFKTPKDSSATEFTVMGITDIQGSIDDNYINSLPNLLLAKNKVGNAAFVISMGDNVDNGKSIYQYEWMLEGQKEFWSSMPFVGVPGNHEDGENELSTHVKLPNEETGKEYYSFVYVNTYFIMLDTNDLNANGTLSTAQYAWLESTLQKAKNNDKIKWIIVGMHKGPFTAGSHAYDSDVIAMRAQLNPLFVQYGVDLVLQGHDHTYTVTNPVGADGKAVATTRDSRNALVNSDGVIYMNLGTMGDKFYDYLYTDAIDESVFMKRDSVDARLAKYQTAEKNLELTETPVFISLTINNEDLTVKTYAIVNGEIVDVDNIILTNSPVYEAKGLTTGQIIAISVGCASFVALVAVVVVIFVRRKKISA